MNHKDLKQTNNLLFFSFAVFAVLYFGASFLIPLTFAAFLAALMAPLTLILEKAGTGRVPAAILCTLIVSFIIGGLSYLFFFQLRLFTDELPLIQKDLELFFTTIQHQVSSATGFTAEEQKELWQQYSERIRGTVEVQAANLLGNVLTSSLKFLLVLIYMFLLLLYRRKFSEVILKYVPAEKKNRSKSILYKTSRVANHYLWGRIKVMAILASMYLTVFLIFDVPYTILLTVFGALITIIPYVGPFISGLLPILMVILFGKDFSEVLLFSTLIIIIQLIESYVLEPVIIGSEVQLNPLIVIVAVVIGGLIWGVAGMILFVPLFSMIKIFSDHTPNLKPLGFLMGNTH